MSDVSVLLADLAAGKPVASDHLLPLVYDELRKLASAKLAREKPGMTLQSTALVHEAYLKLVGNESRSFANRQHFFAAASEAMRRILIDSARRKNSIRHGGHREPHAELHEIADLHPALDLPIEVNELIDQMANEYPRAVEVFKMRFFLQMTFMEIGEILGFSPDTAANDWAFARAWLKRAYDRVGD